ncbi:MAG: FecR domain-containing protein [Cyclobacteriaceae bacterium]
MEELLSKYFSGEATDEEIQAVEDWRMESKDNAKSFFEAKKVWLASTPVEEPNQVVLTNILSNHEDDNSLEVIPLWNQPIFRIAAAIVLVLGVVFSLLKNNDTNVYGEPVSEVTSFDLPDGSVATLQRGASITIGDFSQSRDVELVGKAFFEVEKNPDKPFTVVTKNASVRVLGTSFVVDASEESNAVEVLVRTGKVTFAQNTEQFGQQSLKIDLEKGEMGIIKLGEKGIKKKNLKDENYLAWKTKNVNFKSTDLQEVAAVVEDMYGVKYQFDSQRTKTCKLTAKFEKKSADEITNLIAQTFGLSVEKSTDGYLFRGEGCD